MLSTHEEIMDKLSEIRRNAIKENHLFPLRKQYIPLTPFRPVCKTFTSSTQKNIIRLKKLVTSLNHYRAHLNEFRFKRDYMFGDLATYRYLENKIKATNIRIRFLALTV